MKEKYTFYYKRLRRYQDSDENTEKEPSSKSKVKVGLLPLNPLKWGKRATKTCNSFGDIAAKRVVQR